VKKSNEKDNTPHPFAQNAKQRRKLRRILIFGYAVVSTPLLSLRCMNHVLAFSIILFAAIAPAFCQKPDSSLRRVRELDVFSKNGGADIPTLPAAEHLARAETYSSNRMFPEARAHWMKVLDVYPNDAGIPKALFGIARSFMWERQYDKAVEWFEKLTKDYLDTKDGREGLAFKAASYVRLGENVTAAKTYEQYVTMFPNGERIDSAHLNIIDAYREAGKYDEAEDWINKTVARFDTTPTEINALHARLRMEIFRGRWQQAVSAADALLAAGSTKGSMTSADEVRYLKAVALESLGRKQQAMDTLGTIPNSYATYFGGIASTRLAKNGAKMRIPTPLSTAQAAEYKVVFRDDLLRESRKRNIDPRYMLAIMKQESVFKPSAKSPAGARGLLQLVYDTALKYKDAAGFLDLQPDDLYKPSVNIALGAEYIAFLKDEFGGLYEGIAASYNGGEDNALRWLNRTKPKDPGIFTAEVGFAETKAYVQKVMNNYRAYSSLYDENLLRK
jgi:soluble lytic murein transglycosylase